jgi:hypothetical protein
MHVDPTPESDIALLDVSARAMASSFIFPISLAQAMTAAVRILRRQSHDMAVLRAEVQVLRDRRPVKA